MTQDVQSHSIKISVVVSIIVSVVVTVTSAVWFVSKVTNKIESIDKDVADIKKTQQDFLVEVRGWRKQYEERLGKIENEHTLMTYRLNTHLGTK